MQKNFQLDEATDQALRELAFRTRQPQGEHIRRALRSYLDAADTPPDGDAERRRRRRRELSRKIAAGEGIDRDLLLDGNRVMWATDE